MPKINKLKLINANGYNSYQTPPDFGVVWDHILASSSVPLLDDVFVCLLHISSTQFTTPEVPFESSILISPAATRGGRGIDGRSIRLLVVTVVVTVNQDNVQNACIATNLVTHEISASNYMNVLLTLPTLSTHMLHLTHQRIHISNYHSN